MYFTKTKVMAFANKTYKIGTFFVFYTKRVQAVHALFAKFITFCFGKNHNFFFKKIPFFLKNKDDQLMTGYKVKYENFCKSL